jgi:hypothetical protein
MIEDLNNIESNNNSLLNFSLFGIINSFDGGVITNDIYPAQNNTVNIGKTDAKFASVFVDKTNTNNLNLVSDLNNAVCFVTTDTQGDLTTSAANLQLNNGNATISSVDSAINLPAGSSIGNIPWGLVQLNGVLNSPSDLPENSNVGAAFIIERNLWICYESGPPALFQNAGNFTGPQGTRGARGLPGPPGPGFESIEYDPDNKKYSLFFDPESKKITYG